MTTSIDTSLRPVVTADLDVFFEHQRDPLANHLAAFGARDPEDRGAFDHKWGRILDRADSKDTLRTIETTDNEVAGYIALYRDPEVPGPEVTYWLGSEFSGRGIATQALELFLELIPTRPIFGRVAEHNQGSLRVLQKVGFLPISRSTAASTAGEPVTEVLLRLDARRDDR